MKTLLLCLAVLLSLTTPHVGVTENIVFIHPEEETELWTTDNWDAHNARLLFKHSDGIEEVAVQKRGPYIVFTAYNTEKAIPGQRLGQLRLDAYLIDRTRPHEKARNLTQQRHDLIEDVAISHTGDVVFCNGISGRVPKDHPYGIFFIPREELTKAVPKVRQILRDGSIWSVNWAPDGEHIAFSTRGGHPWILTFNERGWRARGAGQDIYSPVFSPDGSRLAVAHVFMPEIAALTVTTSTHPYDRLITMATVPHVSASHFIWDPGGQALIYTVRGKDRRFHSYRAPLDGGPHEELFESLVESPYSFDWTHGPYAVEPAKKLTTLWGALKAPENIR